MAQIKVKARKDSEYRIIPASGVWGGVTPYGMVCFDLVLEKPEAPTVTTIDVNEATGHRVETIQEPKGPSVERILMAGILVRPEIARVIGHWLIEKADEADMLEKSSDSSVLLQ
ncbi:MAG: hypothetical protein LBQ00_01650 [Syntrophobacterales bacterium]|jgi:hypothetical protein|nr:hypothetical protein [Syntrophobacterales bacterium]